LIAIHLTGEYGTWSANAFFGIDENDAGILKGTLNDRTVPRPE